MTRRLEPFWGWVHYTFRATLRSPLDAMPRPLRRVLSRGPGVSIVLGASLAWTAPAQAQHRSPRFDLGGPAPSSLTVRPVAPDTASRRDFRWLGTAVGAVGLGLAAALEARAYCGNSENGPRDCTGVTIGVGLLGAAVGGALGHLIGRAIPRH